MLTNYAPGERYTDEAGVTLYAVWRYIPKTYEVKYDANGGGNTPASQTKTEDVTLILTSTIPTRYGYTFKGWATNPNATSATYQAGGSYNKLSLARKAEKEENPKVQLLLRRDMKFLDDIQLQMSTAREFMFAYRITHESEDGALATLNRIEKNISDQGFEVKRADKDDIKRFLSRYFGHMTEDAIDDVDGERMIKKWIIPD